MSANVAESPSVSDIESNNPYDVLQDDDDEVPTDADQKESDDDDDMMSTQNSARFSPAESDYESAHDTMSLVGKTTKLKRKMDFSDDGPPTNQGNLHSLETAAIRTEIQTKIVPPSSNNSTHSDSLEATSLGEESPDSKPSAKETNVVSTPPVVQNNEPNAEEPPSSPNSARRLFDTRKPAPNTLVNEIAPSGLDKLLYEASQYDSTLIATSGIPTSSQPTTQLNPVPNMNSRPSTQAHARAGLTSLPAAGRGRGGSSRPRVTVHPGNNLPAVQIPPKQAVSTIFQTTLGDMDTPMPDAQAPVQHEPDFSFTRPTYSDPILPSPARKNFFRCTWRVDTPKNTAPEEGVRDAILEIWSALKDADRRLIIYPWHQLAHGHYKALSDTSKFPKKKDTMIRYFKDAYFRPHAGPMYIRVYIGCDLSDEELGKLTSGFFNSLKNRTRIGFWKNPLQFEEIVEIGWLFHSTPGMDASTIQDEIFRHCGIKTALRWKINATELKGNLPRTLQIRAYHVSVHRKDMAAAKFVLTRKIFARHRRSHFIGGSPMQLIPIMKDVSPNHKQKCIYYIALQSSFLNKIDSMESWEIINLTNVVVGLNGASLRRLILEIPLRDKPSRQAFLSVDRAFNNASTKFYFFKANASECRSRITTLLPSLVFTNPTKEKGIKSCFSGEANERSKGVKWDAERMEVMTADDEILDMYRSIYDEEDDQDLVNEFAKKILLDCAEVNGSHVFAKPAARATKVQEKDASSLFSRSTIASRQNQTDQEQSQNSELSDDDNENNSDDTPRTVNKTVSTADTVGLSSLSTSDIQTKMDLMAQAITKFIPDTPENQAFLAQFSAAFSQSSRVGSPPDIVHPKANAPGQRL
jgi:hypothetical protein